MVYKKFLETVRQRLQKKLGSEYRLEIRPILKNNGIMLDGLCLEHPGSRLAPTVYLNPYYEQYCDGMKMDEVLNDILRLFRDNPPPPCITQGQLTDFELMKPKIMLRLIHAQSNEPLLQEIPCIPYLDLAVVFYLALEHNATGQMTSLIYNTHMKQWGTTAQDLLALALENTPVAYPAAIRSLTDVIKDIARQNLNDRYDERYIDRLLNDENNVSPLYMLSNETGIYGAACLLYPQVLKNFADELGQDLIIIPSSIHEVLLAPCPGGMTHRELNDMVADVNRTEVLPEDRLSDHIYYYTRSNDRIRINPR